MFLREQLYVSVWLNGSLILCHLLSSLYVCEFFKFLSLCRFACAARLQCEASGLKTSSKTWSTCPAAQCNGTSSIYLGNVTDSTNCNQTTCAYSGFTNETIFTTLATESTCPAGWYKLLLLCCSALIFVCLVFSYYPNTYIGHLTI